MKIAFISLMGDMQWGGSEELWVKTAMYALKEGHQVFASILDWGTLAPKIKELQGQGAQIHLRSQFNPQQSIFKKTISHFKNRYSFLNPTYKQLLDFQPDRIFINQGGTYDIIIHHSDLKNVLSQLNKPFYLMCHSNSDYSWIPPTNIYPTASLFFEQAKQIFFVSQKMKNTVERQIIKKLDNAKVICNPLNMNRFEIVDWTFTNTFHFATVGFLGNTKGQDILFEVLSQSQWKERNWILNLYGSGYGEQYLKDLAQFYGISDKINFCGYSSDIAKVWEENHILLSSSATEGLPLSLVEAMICGRTAVVTDVGGNTELIEDNVNGFVAEAPSVKSFEKALERAWKNREQWQQMGEKAHTFAMKTIDLQADKTLFNLIKN